MATVEATEDNFNSLIEDNDMVIVDFWAPWCGPCRSFAPTFESASESHPAIVFAKVNTEDQQALAAAFHIRSIPTLMAFREQVVLYAQPGALPASGLAQLIGQMQGLDMDVVRADIAAAQTSKPS